MTEKTAPAPVADVNTRIGATTIVTVEDGAASLRHLEEMVTR